MHISLIMATIGRTTEVERFLRSLADQTYRDFDLIVVDQNDDGRLESILAGYRDSFHIKHLISSPGLSKARNVGLRHVTGDIVGFPDDDCWYDPELLNQTVHYFREHSIWDGLSGRPVGMDGKTSIGRFDCTDGPIDKFNIWRRVNSNTLFLSADIIKSVGDFDETLGVGAMTYWGSGEDTDYPLRAIQKDFKLFYLPDIIIRHPHVEAIYNSNTLRKRYLYGAGMGRVLHKHRYPVFFKFYYLIRPLGGALLALLCGKIDKAMHHLALFRGRMKGLLG